MFEQFIQDQAWWLRHTEIYVKAIQTANIDTQILRTRNNYHPKIYMNTVVEVKPPLRVILALGS